MKQIYSKIRAALRCVTVLAVLLVVLWPRVAAGQASCSNTTEGQDFWMMFLDNFDNAVDISFTITASNTVKDDGTWIFIQVTITNPNMKWSKTVNVPVGGSTTVEVPKKYAVGSSTANKVGDYAFHITSTADVSVYASSFVEATFDIATIYPTSTLDTEYVVQTYEGLSGYGTEVGVVATTYGTEVKMILPCAVTGGYKKGDTLTVELDKGETYQLKPSGDGNLSGMRILSNGQPIAVFQGTGCTNVPAGCAACDHLYEQTLPLKMWGQTYVIVPVATHTGGDRAIVTAERDSCVVTYDSTTTWTLNAGESKEFEVDSKKSHILEATSPVTVCLYIKGQACAGGESDPSAVIVPPVEQGLKKVRFEALSTDRTKYHYVNIIVPTEAKDSMLIDDEQVNGTFSDLNNGYSTVQLLIDAGTHTLYNSQGKFVAYFYGLGDYESYAYIAGMSLRNLRNHIYVNGVDKTDDTSAYIACFGKTVDLKVEINGKDPGTWYVDSVYVHYIDTLIHYDFETEGLHRVDAVSPSGCDTLTAYVFCRSTADTVDAEICFGDTYQIDTFSFNTTGMHTFAVVDEYGCDSMVTVDLTIIDSFLSVLVDTGCFDKPYQWQGKQYSLSGRYVDTLTSSHGCDSVLALDLTVLARPEVTISSESHCVDGSYTLSVDLSNAATNGVWPEHRWFSEPPDPTLEGHENEVEVRVLPQAYTVYGVEVYYHCKFIETTGLNVVSVPHAAVKVLPAALDYDRPSFEAHDISENAGQRYWWVDDELMTERGGTLYRDVDVYNTDSVLLTLVAGDGICYDTVRYTLNVWHTGIYAPNMFLPETYDDSHFIVRVHDAELISLSVYSRNGLRVFYDDVNPAQGWDGTYEGKPCPQGTYVWTATYRRADSPTRNHTATGTLTLMR